MPVRNNERTEEVRQFEFRATEGGDGQTLEGYAAVYDTWTDINDRAGTFRERFRPGAFKRSLGQRTPVMQFEHGKHPLIGSIPIGTYSVAREDRNGMFVRGRLSDNWMIQPVRDAIRDKAITGMSIRFRVLADEWGTDAEGRETRDIIEAEVAEAGPVVFPAYETTSVAVRSLIGTLDDETRTVLEDELVATNARRIIDAIKRSTSGTSDAASEPAIEDDGPDEPPVASRTPKEAIRALLVERHPLYKETSDVSE